MEDEEKMLRAISYHIAIIGWHTTAMKALTKGLPKESINKHTLPINIFSPKLINQYTHCIERELVAFENGEPSPFQPVKR
jgi:hypothetical protein